MIRNVLTIAGSDSSGGAGIQADLKAISATGSYACSVLTALTAQNTQGVSAIHAIPSPFIAAQCDAVFQDVHIDAVKIGMVNDANVIVTIAEKLRQYRPSFVVLDPVMIATSGAKLLQDEAQKALIEQLFPLATVITPNVLEAMCLTNTTDTPKTPNDIHRLIHQLQQRFSQPILLKGGHCFFQETSTDWLIHQQQTTPYSTPIVHTQNTHGTGCTLSSALASYLAQGQALPVAIEKAKHYVTQALISADKLHVGQGAGPVDHFFQLRETNA